MLKTLPKNFVRKVAIEIEPLYRAANQKLNGKPSNPTVDELEDFIQEVYQEFVKLIEKNPDDYCIESGGIEIREEMGDLLSISYRRSFYIDKDGSNAIY